MMACMHCAFPTQQFRGAMVREPADLPPHLKDYDIRHKNPMSVPATSIQLPVTTDIPRRCFDTQECWSNMPGVAAIDNNFAAGDRLHRSLS